MPPSLRLTWRWRQYVPPKRWPKYGLKVLHMMQHPVMDVTLSSWISTTGTRAFVAGLSFSCVGVRKQLHLNLWFDDARHKRLWKRSGRENVMSTGPLAFQKCPESNCARIVHWNSRWENLHRRAIRDVALSLHRSATSRLKLLSRPTRRGGQSRLQKYR
jgi:hypothetical protein